MDHGKLTGELGKELKKIVGGGYKVIYAHGHADGEIHRPTAYFGDYSTETTLSEPDILIIAPDRKTVSIVAEIEESGSNPKKFIGDVGSILLSRKIRHHGRDYDLVDPIFIYGGIGKAEGRQREKMDHLANKFNALSDKLDETSLSVVPIIRANLKDMIDAIQEEIVKRTRDETS